MKNPTKVKERPSPSMAKPTEEEIPSLFMEKFTEEEKIPSPSMENPTKEKRPSPSHVVEVSTFEEQFPCSEEMEAYLIHRFHEASFRALWESVRPVEIVIKESHLILRGSCQDMKNAIHWVYEHPLLKDILVVFAPSLKTPDIKKINKKLSKCYSSSTFLLNTTKSDTKVLLCSTSPTELLNAQAFLEVRV